MSSPRKFQQLLQEAVAHHRGGRHARAEGILRQLTVLGPRNAQLHDVMGQLAQEQGRGGEAVRCFQLAVQLDPRSVPFAVHLALALNSAGQSAEAEKVMRRTTQMTPGVAEGWNVLGFVLKAQGRLGEAAECHERAVQLEPKLVEGWYHLAHALASAGQNFQALGFYERALALQPGFIPARFGRAQALHKSYRLPEAIAEYEAILRTEPRHHEARSCRLWALQGMAGFSREQLWAEHQAYGAAVGQGPATLPGYDPAPDRRLRLAILSPDLRTHSCAYFIAPLVCGPEAKGFELFLYHDHFFEDEVSARLRSHAAVWRNFAGRTNADVERAIRADRPDILIDLAGHIGTSIRLPLFARRLAPVQVTYLGYPDTTGVAAMDFRFTDAIADPPGDSDRFHSERLVRFAPSAWAYQPPDDAPAVAPLPGAGGAGITFGCFSNPTKFTDAQFAVWADLLARVPRSRLVLKGRDFEVGALRDSLLSRMQAQGLPLDRLELLPRTSGTAEHLALYGRIDVALDTFPYAGTTTTCEALWMGRPVVTRCGDRHAARVGASLLSAVGHPEWIARTDEDFVRIATELAAAPAELAAISAALRGEMARSALLDHRGQATRFFAALRDCWKERGQEVAGATRAA